jgi:predicted short-subunit dehydrogenase-like oxidoreductase (DUF2520 family)
MTKIRIVGSGRAGRSFELAMTGAGLEVDLIGGRSPRADLACAAEGVDGVLLAVADRFVAEVAERIDPSSNAAVMHCSGSLPLDVLGDRHRRRASLHPLATLPDPVIGSMRLQGGTYFAVSGDQLATDLALALGGKPIVVAETDRVAYHAAACVAANHLVALLGQVGRIAAGAGLPLEAFLPLALGALDDVSMLGPPAALTGPAARGDLATIDAHRARLDGGDLRAYDALAVLAAELGAGGDPGAGADSGTGRIRVPSGR